MKYAILQLDTHNPDVMKGRKLFIPWRLLNQHSKFDISQYKKVYEGEVEDQGSVLKTLDHLFEKFNLHHPSDFNGHSLSVSDVVVLDGVSYYCDSYDWINTETGKEIL